MGFIVASKLDKAFKESIIPNESAAEEVFRGGQNLLDRDMFIEKYYAVISSGAGRSNAERDYEYDVKEYERLQKNPNASARNEEWAEAVVDADNLALKFCQTITDPEKRMEYYKLARFVYRAKRKDSPEFRNQLQQELSAIGQSNPSRRAEIEAFFNFINLEETYAARKADADVIREKMRNISGLAELEELESSIKQLVQEQYQLGMFKRKEKKELQERIDSLKAKRPSFDYVTKAQAELKAELQEANSKAVSLKNMIDEINTIGLAFTNKTRLK